MSIVRKSRKDLPPVSQKRLDELAAIPDEQIDYSDIPPLGDDFWENAEIRRRDQTQPVTLRVKESVLAYFKAEGKGYQTRINAVLESYVRAQERLKSKLSRDAGEWAVIYCSLISGVAGSVLSTLQHLDFT